MIPSDWPGVGKSKKSSTWHRSTEGRRDGWCKFLQNQAVNHLHWWWGSYSVRFILHNLWWDCVHGVGLYTLIISEWVNDSEFAPAIANFPPTNSIHKYPVFCFSRESACRGANPLILVFDTTIFTKN
jgi:hypothetical protein